MKTIIFTIASLVVSIAAYADPHDVYGVWLSEAKDGLIEISDCGNDTPCGVLVWVDPAKEPTDRDERNRNADLRNRKLIGVPIVWGYSRGRSGWHSGNIYNPEDGKTFWSSVKRRSNGTLKVKGCLGPLCITNTWTSVDADGDA